MFRSIAFAAASFAAAAFAGSAQAVSTIHLFASLGPGQGEAGYESHSFEAYADNLLRAVLDDQSSRGGSLTETPTAFNTLTSNTVDAFDIIATEFPSWRGDLAPTGAFADERGTQLRMAVRVESDAAFNLTQVTQYFTDNHGTDEFTLAERVSATGFTPRRAIGVWYGPDGVRGTPDDVVCDSTACDPATQMLNLVAYIGLPKIADLDYAGLESFYGGDKQAFRDDWLYYIRGGYDVVPPFFMQWNYLMQDAGETLASATSARFEISAAPEPGAWALMVVGFGVVGWSMRRRKQAPA